MATPRHLASSFLRCAVCGSSLVVSGTKKRNNLSYVCDKHRMHGRSACRGIGYRAEHAVDAALLRAVAPFIGGDIAERALGTLQERRGGVEARPVVAAVLGDERLVATPIDVKGSRRWQLAAQISAGYLVSHVVKEASGSIPSCAAPRRARLQVGVSHPSKRSRGPTPRAVDFRFSSFGHGDRQARRRDDPLGRRGARVGLGDGGTCARDSRVGLDDRFIGPRDRASGLEERGIGRVNRRWRHA